MNMTAKLKKFLSALLVFILVFALLPVSALAAGNESIILIAGGDYQQAGSHTNSSSNVTNILKKIIASGLTKADGFLFVGDYDCETHDDATETSNGITSLMSSVQSVYSNLNYDNTILVQGNHDYKDSRIDATGGHTFNGYSVFVMNEDDYPNYGGSPSQAKNLSAELDEFLAGKLAEGYSAPIFVTSHVPLHFGPRTNRQGDGKYGRYYFDVMNKYGAEGLNIIFMHGHNHAYGYDEYIGGEAIYLAVGDKINIAVSGSQSSYTTETLNFTYMNAGYTGYYNESGYSTSSGTDFLTMTTFQIYGDRVVINRFSEDGLYNMKSAGQLKGDYISSVSVSANSTVYASAQTINLTAPAERITLENTATGISVTGIKTDGIFDDSSDLVVTGPETIEVLENAAKCAAYQAYTLDFSCSGTVSIKLPIPETYPVSSTKIYQVNGSTLTELDATIANSAATFTATAGGTFAVVREVTASASASVYYERVGSVSELVSGEEYLIIFDCSSQTTADAFVIPQIATYSSGSSKRMGPDVVVSDGIADEEIITGSYDDHLWTLTKSGSGWLIGNGSQNINVTYNSTSSRCELAFTTSGEALTIASVSNNPGDADSSSFAIYDSSNYYWQYNTSATLIYGTTSDSYTSRFHLYKRVENTPSSDPETDKGWVSLPSGGTYVLDTDGVDFGAGNKYIIVGNNNAYALTLSNGTIGQAAVTISNNTITVDDPSIFEFYFADNGSNESSTYLLTQDGTNTVYHANGNMYYGTDNKGYWHVGSSSNGTYKVYDYDNMNWYLNYGYVWSSESVSRFAVSSNTRYVRLFKCTSSVSGDAYIRLSGDTEQTYTIADSATEASVLANVSISVTADGYHVSDSLAVTSDMVAWNTAFNGKTAGTYTGTVTYEGLELGTITVIITAQHNYETVTVAATCTEAGSVTTTCTVCGDSSVEEIPALGHEYTCATTDATCGKDGAKVYTCVRCDDTYTEVIAATGKHTYETVTVNATCIEAGSVTTTCTVCGDSSVEEIPVLGHDYTCATTDATCGKDGAKVYTCSRCDDTYTEVIAATGKHTYETVTVAATCTEAGSVTTTCTVCGDSSVEVLAAIGHSYNSTVTAPDCTEDGFTTYTCATCGHSYVADRTAALGHSYDSVITATCTEDGFVVYTCTVCGHSYNGEAVEAIGHSYETTVVAPTCATAGYTTYVCTTCGHTYTGNETAALGHDYDAAVTEATCTGSGFTTYTCATCGLSYVADQVAALGHSYESVVTAPTFETEGFTTHTCTVCGDVKVDSYVPVLSHTYETVTVDATCTEDGSVTHTCVTCGYTYTEVLPAIGHAFETVTVDATCTENGSIVSTCTNCGDVETEVIPALGHSYETTRFESTCTEPGFVTSTCACGYVVTQEIPALGHSYEASYVAPGCDTNGGTTYTCHCGHSYSDVISALGHSYTSQSVAPTCTKEGYTTYTCGTCGDSYVGDKTAALGHSYEGVVTAPTCTEGGFTTYTCAVCGDAYVGDKTAALGHSNTEVVTAPTCTEAGYTTYTCIVCGHSSVGNSVAALGHSYTSVESNGYMVYTCRCGDSYSEKIENLTYTRVSSISSGNSYVITLYSGNKYYALSHANNQISVVQVSYSNKQITSEITEDLVWNYSGSKLSYENGGKTYYLHAQSASGWWGWMSTPTLTLSTSSSTTVSFSSSKLKLGSYYLRYSSGKVSLNRSATTTYFFIEE